MEFEDKILMFNGSTKRRRPSALVIKKDAMMILALHTKFAGSPIITIVESQITATWGNDV